LISLNFFDFPKNEKGTKYGKGHHRVIEGGQTPALDLVAPLFQRKKPNPEATKPRYRMACNSDALIEKAFLSPRKSITVAAQTQPPKTSKPKTSRS